MMMMSFSRIGLISILWLLYGFTLAFGVNDDALQQLHRQLHAVPRHQDVPRRDDLWGATAENPSGTGIPIYVFMVFQMMFAVITVALISGAISDRTKFAGWLLFAFGWFTLVYFPVAHWVWGGGFIGAEHPRAGLRRWYGGAHQRRCRGARRWRWSSASGSAGRGRAFKPHNVPLVALGAGLLWFGWFGFNAGSELTVDSVTAVVAFINTQVATAAARARLDRRRVDPGRQADHGRRLVRRRRRPGRDHPGLWLHRAVGGGRCSASSPVRSAPSPSA